MVALIPFLFFACTTGAFSFAASVVNSRASTPFTFSVMNEPESLDPAALRGSSGGYLFTNLHRGLYRYDRERGLVPEAARDCVWEGSLRLVCDLNPEFRWSDGEPVRASDFVRSFRRLFDRRTKSVATELLMHLKSARRILKGESPPESLGVAARGDLGLVFELESADADFRHKLASPQLAPVAAGDVPKVSEAHRLKVTGPYRIHSWKSGKFIELKPNPYYFVKKSRPDATVLFVDDDATALRLFETGRLNLLRRLQTENIPPFRKHPGFLQVPVARFDYVGFGPDLKEHKDLRQALAHALNYQELADLYHARGRPGCPSLPADWLDRVPCHEFDVKRAKEALARVPTELRKRRWVIGYSLLGGDDIKRGMEWMQNQWQRHLGLNFELQAREQGMYLQDLKVRPPAVFRKGVSLDRPTCLAALENFLPEAPENYIGLNDPAFTQLVARLQTSPTTEAKTVCRSAVARLLDEYRLIPLGEIHFTLLHDGRFKGWRLNELNQLDLTDLEPAQSPKPVSK